MDKPEFNLDTFQVEHREWQTRNFGSVVHSEHMLMGMIEEIGELTEGLMVTTEGKMVDHNLLGLLCAQVELSRAIHCCLKRVQGIRGNPEQLLSKEIHHVACLSEIACATYGGIHLAAIVNEGIDFEPNRDIPIKDSIGDLTVYLSGFCSSLGLSLSESIQETWNEVKQRDWTKNKLNGKVE